MTGLMVQSKRPRAPSFSEKHHHEYSAAGGSDWVPEKKEKCHEVEVRSFLELCRFCKKKLREEDDVFMYGYLGAFCSKGCREKQMACDIFKELHSRGRDKSIAKKGRICLTNKPKDESSSSLEERIITPSPTRFFI